MSKITLNYEQIVLNVIIEYLNKNRQFNMKKILPFITSRLGKTSININQDGIERIIFSLMQNKLIREGSKLHREKILENSTRNDIFQYICQNPGKYINLIEKDLDLSHHVVVWHIKMLINFDFISKENFDDHELYFESDKDFKIVKLSYILSKEKNNRIVNYLKENDIGVNKTTISNNLNIHLQTLSKYLKELVEYGIIIKENIDKTDLYFPKK